MFQIGDLSKHADVPEKTIRYYEEIGLLPPARRSANSYRVYDAADYGKYIYSETPQPPLSPEDGAWAQQFVPPTPGSGAHP